MAYEPSQGDASPLAGLHMRDKVAEFGQRAMTGIGPDYMQNIMQRSGHNMRRRPRNPRVAEAINMARRARGETVQDGSSVGDAGDEGGYQDLLTKVKGLQGNNSPLGSLMRGRE